jgi:hypothetical protein
MLGRRGDKLCSRRTCWCGVNDDRSAIIVRLNVIRLPNPHGKPFPFDTQTVGLSTSLWSANERGAGSRPAQTTSLEASHQATGDNRDRAMRAPFDAPRTMQSINGEPLDFS